MRIIRKKKDWRFTWYFFLRKTPQVAMRNDRLKIDLAFTACVLRRIVSGLLKKPEDAAYSLFSEE